LPARRLPERGRGPLGGDRGGGRRGLGALRRRARLAARARARLARRSARGPRRPRPSRRRVDARAERRGVGRGAPGGGRLRHAGRERRRAPRRPAPRRARRDRDRRAPRDRPRAAQREPAPALADAARAADRRPAPRRRHRGRADPRPRSLARPGGAPRRGRRAHVSAPTIRDRAAIVGIGQTAFGKSLGRSEYDLALEAILAACADAGLSPRDIDGTVRYDMETTDEENLLAALGNPALGWFASSAWGGGGAASVLVLAATAIAAGMASTLLVTSAARARDLRQPPAYILAGAMAAGGHHVRLSTFYDRERHDDGGPRAARRLWAMAAVGPGDIDVACFYDFFTPLVIMALEDYGFAKPGEG